MTSLTVRNIPDDAKRRFRQVAASHGRSMEEHLRQLVINAGFGDEAQFSGVRDVQRPFHHAEPLRADAKAKSRSRVERLIEIADGAGEGVFDKGKYAEIRFMTAKDAIKELRRLANGVGFDAPPRLSTELEAPEF